MKPFITLFLTSVLLLSSASILSAPMTEQQAVNIAQQQFPGRVLSVKSKGEMILVKILNRDGEIRIIKVKSRENTLGSSTR